ncbi:MULTISPECIES: RNA polymerase sigma factor [Nostocales]|uniref:Sigma-70 family RNA polymerase sigma factor n=3 Tax=Nostocales TaxID=1161 RepID=A0A0C1R4X8_9CYAN
MNDQQLKELALKIQQQPINTTARRVALSKLICGIYRSGKLYCSYKCKFQKVYQDIYDEALQNLFLYVCKNIDKYDPERSEFMTWINMLLNQRFFKEAIPKILGKGREIQVESSFLENLEALPFEESNGEDDCVTAFQKIRQYIEKDPKSIFQQAYMKKYPKVNFREIAIKKWSGISWKEMSDEFDIPIPTLSNFYQRCLEKFRDDLREVCGLETIQ